MSRVFLLLALLAVLLAPSAAQTMTFCQTYSGTTTNATAQINLLTAIVGRAAAGGTFTAPSGTSYTIAGLFSSTGPLYSIFTGQVQYRVGAPNYVTDMPSGSLAALVTHLVGYFGALFGCTAAGYTPVNNANMYAVHANMSINNNMETYFNAALANTLLSFGVSSSDVTNVAAPALSLFNRCAQPISAISSTAPVQVCGTSDCPLAPATNCSLYPSSNDATSKQAMGVSVVFIVVAAVVATLVL